MPAMSRRTLAVSALSWLLLLPIGIACGPSASPKDPQPALPAASTTEPPTTASSPAPPSAKEVGAQVIAWLNAGEDSKVRAILSDAMNKAMPNDAALAQLWKSITGKVGAFKKLIDTEEKEEGSYHVVLVTCDFEVSPMDVRLVFDKERHLAGVSLKQTQSPNAFGPRPQHPKPPFGYEAREVAYDNEKDKAHFTGTLTVPKGDGPFPAVLLITGSGTQDRDETIFGHKPFWVIADQLTKNGIAVLRVDDPGAGGSTGDVKNATIEAHGRDAEAGIAFLKAQKEIDPKRIGLIGHSEGGIIAAVVASHSKDVAYIVSLAGTGLSGAEINPMQIEAILHAEKRMKPEGVKAIVAAQRKLMKLIAKDADDKAIEAAVKEAFSAAHKHAPSEADKDAAQKQVAQSLTMLQMPWFKSFVKLDPRQYWEKVTVPVLAMNGAKDTQVPADENLDAIKKALARNKDVDAQKLAGLNHLFQPAESGLLDEYGKIETTFDPNALDLMTTWLKKHANVK